MPDRHATIVLLDSVTAEGTDFALSWLRAAYITHEEQKARLLADLAELRSLYLANVSGPLSVREAQLLHVCRVCRRPWLAGDKGNLVLNHGREHAHERCLAEAGESNGPGTNAVSVP